MEAVTSSQATTVTLPTDQQILITRTFDAAPHLVYRALTTPELVSRWWPAGLGGATSIEIDLRVGGAWRYAMVTPGGFEVAYQATDGALHAYSSITKVASSLHLGMKAGTSPAITALPSGGFAVAIVANNGNLWTWSSGVGAPANSAAIWLARV